MSQRGVVTAFVDEVDARQGRVKVEYKAIEDRMLSPWAYIAAPMSGKGRGALFMPEKGDEVLVCFADGQFGHPYVVGFLWNGEHTSPEKEAHNRVIVTPGGHQLRFEDKDNDTRVILRSSGGHALTMEDRPGGEQLLLKSTQSHILLDDLPAGTKIELKAGQGLGVTITLNATPQPSLSIAVGAGNTISVDSSGISMATAGTANVTVAGAANITAAGAVSVTAGTVANISCPALNVTSMIATFSGVLQASTLVATSGVVSPAYTPGLGNLI